MLLCSKPIFRLTRIYDADLRQVDATQAIFSSVDCTGSKVLHIQLFGRSIDSMYLCRDELEKGQFSPVRTSLGVSSIRRISQTYNYRCQCKDALISEAAVV